MCIWFERIGPILSVRVHQCEFVARTRVPDMGLGNSKDACDAGLSAAEAGRPVFLHARVLPGFGDAPGFAPAGLCFSADGWGDSLALGGYATIWRTFRLGQSSEIPRQFRRNVRFRSTWVDCGGLWGCLPSQSNLGEVIVVFAHFGLASGRCWPESSRL